MPDVNALHPFEAYAGKEPYLFASYAHKDGKIVFAELRSLHERGYRIWYDEGIDPGNEWPEEVGEALANASLFLVFISPAAVESRNVRNEINFALNNEKPFIAVYLEETQLPAGLELRMGDIQAVMKYRMSPENYRRKMEKTLPRALCMPVETVQIEHAVEALRQVVVEGARCSIGGVDVSLSRDGSTLLARMGGEVYPGHIRDHVGHGWQMEGGSGWSDPPRGCYQEWPARSCEETLVSIAKCIKAANDLAGYGWSVQVSGAVRRSKDAEQSGRDDTEGPHA